MTFLYKLFFSLRRRNDLDEFISFTCGDGDDNESEDIISTQHKKKINAKELSFTLVQRF